ncbi:MAG: tetratricopeptide repeat protein [Methanobacteriota archaeon]|nr:MAG: tetratricopeptide repeat protein [Euryarchaeota archaeon]
MMVTLEEKLIDTFLEGRFSEFILSKSESSSHLIWGMRIFAHQLIGQEGEPIQVSEQTSEGLMGEILASILKSEPSGKFKQKINQLKESVPKEDKLSPICYFLETLVNIKEGTVRSFEDIPSKFSRNIQLLLKYYLAQRMISENKIENPEKLLEELIVEEMDLVVKLKYLTLLYSLPERKIEEKINILERLSRLYSELNLLQWEHSTENNLAFFKQKMGRFEEALIHVDKAIEIRKALHDDLRAAKALYLKGTILQNMGRLEDSKNVFHEALDLIKDIGSKDLEGKINHFLGLIAENEGDYPKAILHLEKAMDMLSTNKKLLLQIRLSYVAILTLLGRFIEAEQIYEELYNDAEANQILGSKLYLSMAEFYLTKGEPLKAQSILIETSMSPYQSPFHQAQKLTLLGGIDILLGFASKALEHYKEAEKIYEELGNQLLLVESWFRQFIAQLQLENKDELTAIATKILSSDPQNSTYIQGLINLTEALVLKRRRRLKFLSEAESKLRELQHQDLPFHLHVLTIIHLVEILIIDYENSEEEEVFDEILNMLGSLADTGKTLNLPTIIIDTYILLSRLEIIKGNVEYAFRLLEEAEEMAYRNKLENYLQKVIRESEEIKETIEKMEKTLLTQRMSEKFEKIKVRDYISRIVATANTLPQHYVA